MRRSTNTPGERRRVPGWVTLVVGVTTTLLAAITLTAPELLLAQGSGQSSPLAAQTLGRGYTHMFIAYALAWLLVLAWAISIGRRLAKARRVADEE